MWKQLCSCDPDITLETLTVSKMQELVQWYVKNDYCNRTIQKQFKIVKSFFRWIAKHGYNIQSGVLEFKPGLKVIPRAVTFLKYKELMHFFHYEYPKEKEHLSKARDMFLLHGLHLTQIFGSGRTQTSQPSGWIPGFLY